MKKHIIYSHGRSGSNFFRSLLQSHPEVMNYGEVLAKSRPFYRFIKKPFFNSSDTSDIKYLDWIYSSHSLFFFIQVYYYLSLYKKKSMGIEGTNPKRIKNVKTIGIKEFHENLIQHNGIKYLQNNPDVYVIYLVRGHLLQRYISLAIAEETNVWAGYQGSKPKKKFHVDIEHMLHFLNILEEETHNGEKFYHSYQGPKMKITYEDYFKDPAVSKDYNNKIVDFLEVDHMTLGSDYRKILPKSIEQKVDNYAEIKKALVHTKFKKYLDV